MQFKAILSISRRRIFTLVCISFVSAPAFGKEKAETAPTEKVDVSGSQSLEWTTIQGDLSNRLGKILVEQRILEEMLTSSKAAGERIPPEKLKEIKEQHRKVESMTKDYNELLAKFELRFPERGQQMGRKYYRIDNLTLEQIENRMSLDERRNSLIKKIRTQYNKPENEDTTQKPFDPKRDQRPEVTDQIILVK